MEESNSIILEINNEIIILFNLDVRNIEDGKLIKIINYDSPRNWFWMNNTYLLCRLWQGFEHPQQEIKLQKKGYLELLHRYLICIHSSQQLSL